MSTNSDRLARYIAAETAILEGQSVRHESGRELTMADLSEVRDEIEKLQRAVARENAGGGGFKSADFRADA